MHDSSQSRLIIWYDTFYARNLLPKSIINFHDQPIQQCLSKTCIHENFMKKNFFFDCTKSNNWKKNHMAGCALRIVDCVEVGDGWNSVVWIYTVKLCIIKPIP